MVSMKTYSVYNFNKIETKSKGYKYLPCSICGRLHRVDAKCTKVTCAECYIAGESPTRIEDGVVYWRPEAFKKITILRVPYEKKIWKGAQSLYEKGFSTEEIARRFGVTQRTIVRHIDFQKYKRAMSKKARELKEKGMKMKDIAKELKVSRPTVRKWLKLEQISK